jgi:hypothetical protein
MEKGQGLGMAVCTRDFQGSLPSLSGRVSTSSPVVRGRTPVRATLSQTVREMGLNRSTFQGCPRLPDRPPDHPR